MTLEEKLQNFYEISMEYAREESETELKKHEEALEKIFQEHQEIALRQAEHHRKTENLENQRINNMELSREHMQLKRTMSHQEDVLTEKCFREAMELLAEYRKTPAYVEWMKKQIHEARDFAKDAETHIYIDPSDEHLLPELSACAQGEHVELRISNEPFLGGTRAVIRARNVLIDHSLDRQIAQVREQFQLREEL